MHHLGGKWEEESGKAGKWPLWAFARLFVVASVSATWLSLSTT